jgi:hypothetical protein
MNKVFIVGFGKFGRMALTQGKHLWGKSKVWIIDSQPGALKGPDVAPISGIRVLADGPKFLTLFQNWIDDEDLIIPALPIHLAWSWLMLNRTHSKEQKPILPPEDLGAGLPFRCLQDNGLYLSYADFLCPEKCPAPEHYCYRTKKKRELPLWKLLAHYPSLKGSLGIIESRQVGPGLGGYPFKELRKIRRLAQKSGPQFFVATACRCHGVIHGASWGNHR